MLAKTIKSRSLLTSYIKKNFGSGPGILSTIFNTVDKNTTAYSVARFDPTLPLKGHKPVEGKSLVPEINVTQLSNGFTVITESQVFPGAVHMGFLIDVGTRDESHETSGACLALKNTYLKTLKHTNETINYGMIQMSGGKLEMEYDQEWIYFNGNCIEYDVIDMFQMLVDCALEPRSVLAANVAKSKNRKSHDLYKHLHKYDPKSYNKDMFLRTAYGYNTLGMPTLGMEHNVESIDARMLQQFIMENVTPKKCYIVASGIKNHKEYVDLVKERLGELLPVPEHQYQRQSAQYIGGEYRSWTESPTTNLMLGFEACNWHSVEEVSAVHLMTTLLSQASQSNLNKASKKYPFVDSIQAFDYHFTDSGLFGINIEGAGSHAQDLMNVALESLQSLKQNIKEEDLQKAKAHNKFGICSALETSEGRLTEIAKSYSLYKDMLIHKYCDYADAVTSDQINKVADKILSGKPSLLVTGDAINLVPSVTDVQRQLK